MSIILLRIKWEGVEHIQFNTLTPLTKGAPHFTSEKLIGQTDPVSYNTTCEAWELTSESLKVSLRYAKERNPYLDPEQIRWGRTDIVVNLTDRSATACWTDDLDPKKWNGFATECRVINDEDAEFLGSLNYHNYERLCRPGQAQLRESMLAKSQACALTGPNARIALDIAHIHEAKEGGQATWNNCMLLRADIHRLFDAGLLGFDAEGTPLLHDNMGAFYSEELKDKRLDSQVFDHVKEALAQRTVDKNASPSVRLTV